MPHRLRLLAQNVVIGLGIVGYLLSGNTIQAGNEAWVTDGNGAWDIGANWTTAVPPGIAGGTGSTDKATFGNVLTTSPATVTVDANRNIKDIEFVGNAFGYTLSNLSSLQITNGGSIFSDSAVAGGVTNSITAPIVIQGATAATATFTSASVTVSNNLTIGAVSGQATVGEVTTLTLAGINTGTNSVGATTNGGAGGTVAVVKNGIGTWTLNGTNNFSGSLTVNAGTLIAASSTGLGLAAATTNLNLGEAASGNAATVRFTSNVTSSRPIFLATGAGTLTMATATSTVVFTGGITGTNNLVLENTGTGTGPSFSFNTGSINNAGNITYNGAATASANHAWTSPFGANFTGLFSNLTGSGFALSGQITVNATGTTFAHATTTAAKLMTLTGGTTGTGNLILQNNGTITSGVTISGANTLAHTGLVTNSGTGTGTTLISSIITGSVTGVIQNSLTSPLILQGINSAFAGGVTIKAGTLFAQTSLNSLGTAAVTLGDTIGSANATLTYGLTGAWANAINVISGSTGNLLAITSSASTPSINGLITLNNNLSLLANGFNLTATAGITGTGNLTVSGSLAGTLSLSTTQLNFTGNLTDNRTAGASILTISAPLNITGSVSLGNVGTGLTTFSGGIGSTVTSITQIGNNSLTISGTTVANTGNITFSGTGTSVATFSAASINTAGTITNNGTTSGATALSGALGASVTQVIQNSTTSQLNLSNANLSYVGTTTITSGFLQVSNGTTLGTGPVNIANGGALVLTNISLTTNNVFTINGNGPDGRGAIRPNTVLSNPRTPGSVILGSDSSVAAFTNSAASSSTMAFNGPISNAITGTYNLTISTVYDSAQTTFATVALGSGSNSFGGVGKFLNINDGNVTLTGSGTGSLTSGAAGNPNTTIVLGSNNSGAGNVTFNSNAGGQILLNPILIAAGTGSRTISQSFSADFQGAITLNKDLNVINSAGTTNPFTLSGVITGNGNLITSGTGATNSNVMTFSALLNQSGTISYTNTSPTGGGNAGPRFTISGNIGANVGLITVNVPNSAPAVSPFTTFFNLSGNYNLNAGGVSVTGSALFTIGLNSNTALGVTNSTLTFVTGRLDNTSSLPVNLIYNNAVNANSNFVFGGTRYLNLGSGNFTINNNRTITLAGANTLAVGNFVGAGFSLTATSVTNTGFLMANGVVSNVSSVNVTEGATLSLMNSGNTYNTVNNIGIGGGGGTLAFASPGSLGASSNAATNLVFNASTGTSILRYIGTGDTIARNFTLTTSGQIEASGSSGGVTFSGVPTFTGTQTLSLGGTGANVAAGTASGILGNSGGTLALSKTGTGTWILSNANTFNGGVNVTAGQLTVTNLTGLVPQALSVSAGARFNFNPTTLGALTPSSLTLANNSTLGFTWTGASNSSIAAGSATTVAGTVYLSAISAYASGMPYTVLTAPSGLNNTSYSVLNPTDFTYTTVVNATDVTITPTTATPLPTAYWKGGNLLLPATVWAVSDGSASSNWSANGSGGNTPLVPGATTDVIFSDSTATALQQLGMTLGADMSVRSLTQTSANGVSTNLDPYTLTVGSGGISVNNGAGGVTLNNYLALGIAQSWTNNSANTLAVGGSVNNAGFLLTVTGTGPTTISGVVAGSGGIDKTGNGALTLSAAAGNTYTGGTTVTVGTLLVNNTFGSGTGSGAVTVVSTGTLGGIGIVAPATNTSVTINGRVAPGAVTTTGTVGNLLITTSGSGTTTIPGVYAFDLTGAGKPTVNVSSGESSNLSSTSVAPIYSLPVHDLITVQGNLDVTGMTATINGVTGSTFDNTQSYSWRIAIATGTISGTPGSVTATTGDFSSVPGTFSLTNDSKSVYLNYAAAIPEPATVLGASVLGLLAATRGRRLGRFIKV